ncbi:MAG: DUF1214 domain-containing protein [Lentimicrobium sp.]
MDEELQYIATYDSKGNSLDGSRNYKLHLPPDIPASRFWSIIVYDSHSHLIISTDQLWPSVHSQSTKLLANQDGSVDTWFGPEPPPGKQHNWIKTIPGKSWNLILRLYYPTESWFDKSWVPGKIEEVKEFN